MEPGTTERVSRGNLSSVLAKASLFENVVEVVFTDSVEDNVSLIDGDVVTEAVWDVEQVSVSVRELCFFAKESTEFLVTAVVGVTEWLAGARLPEKSEIGTEVVYVRCKKTFVIFKRFPRELQDANKPCLLYTSPSPRD